MRRLFIAFITIFFVCIASAQYVKYDKTDRFGRLIATDYSEIYEESGREGELALMFFQSADSLAFIIMFKTQEDLDIRSGDKLLFKHIDGSITEIECIDNGSKSTHVDSFGFSWLSRVPDFYRSTDGVMYSITEEQLKTIANNQVTKIRIEETLKYNDRKTTNSRGKSHVSAFADNAYKRIMESYETRQTGLYDGF